MIVDRASSSGGRRFGAIVLLLFGVIAGGCSRAIPPPGAATVLRPPSVGPPAHNTATANNRIMAVPNPVPTKSGVGTTRIEWRAPGSPRAEVRVSGLGEDHVFARGGPVGSDMAPWIQAGHVYTFALYHSAGGRQVLASVVVRGR